MRWLIESEVFGPGYKERMNEAVRAASGEVLAWEDAWWDEGLPTITGPVLFHGSLGNAARIRSQCTTWSPGAFCDVEAFRCSAWYPRARPWLLHDRYAILPANRLVESSTQVLEQLGAGAAAFFRPDSPLKPFSGRVLPADSISLQALDHGFYYEDEELPVVVAPLRSVGREWRFVAVGRRVVAGSAYAADGRRALPEPPGGEAWTLASKIASELEPPEPVYVLDLCEVEGELRLLELNPFSGADLYSCALRDVVASVAELVEQGV